MKSPAGPKRPRPKKQVRLDLRRAAPPPPPDDEIGHEQRSTFWKWFALVAFFHVVALLLVTLFYHSAPAPPPPVQFISLVPPGDTVKGTPGAQAAPKVGPSTPAPAHHHHTPKPHVPIEPVTPPPPPPPAVVQPPTEQVQPKPIIHEENAPPIAEKPKPSKPKPAKPKIKVDLHLVEEPAPDAEKQESKPKHTKKAPPPPSDDSSDQPDRDSSSADNSGLSKEQIAARLGKKLEAAGIHNATKLGASGAVDGHENSFGDFYASLQEQVMDKWQNPDQDDQQAIDPVVQIHVDKDGKVPAALVSLKRSSGNQTIDDSALNAARNLGYTLQPLPDGCPPDISIAFKLTR